ncbi:MAG: MBL fold metallo-hydrolase [bacterium]
MKGKNNLNIYTFTLSEFYTNNYCVVKDNKVLLIDCTESQPIIDFIQKEKLEIVALILTHAHADHICGVNNFCQKFNVTPFLNPLDQPQIEISKQVYQAYGFKEKPDFQYNPLKEGKLYLETFEIEVIFTPGHTEGSVSFKMDNLLFSGDTIFKNSIGRTDLPGGDFYTLIKSIKEKILILPEDTLILPGHGDYTTIKDEKKFNPFLINT